MEDYLKAVYRLREQGGSITTQRIAEELGVTGPSVTNMIKRLDELHLLEHTRYQGVELTAVGRENSARSDSPSSIAGVVSGRDARIQLG